MTRIGSLGVLALILIVISIGGVSAFKGNFFGIDPENNEDITNAIKAKNFNAWKAAMSDRLTEDRFNTLVERYEAMSERQEQRQNIIEAIEAGDYETFQTAAENSPVLNCIQNENDFEMLVQLHQAKQDRDYEKMRELSEQLGLAREFCHHAMPGQFGRGRMG